MSNSSHILDLAITIQSQVLKIHEHLEASGNGGPTFDGQAPDIEFDGVNDTRTAALENLTELIDLLSTPREILQQKTATDFLSRHALDRFNVYDAVPVGETRTYEQISTATRQPMPVIRRIIRHAMTQRIFHEPSPGVVAHTQVSRLLTENTPVRGYYGTTTQ
jgi:hypothetical protein